MIGVLVGAGVAAFLAVLFAWSHRGHHHHFDAETNPEATSTTSISAQQNPSIQDNEK
jgi:fatty-acid desaturase